ncbi:MAG: hypothetical protein WAL25_08145 [Acidimicrobiia bacterium]
MSHREEDDKLLFGASDRIELFATIVMALAAILTAWCAFEAGMWSGIQAIEFSASSGDRIESTRADTLAGQQRIVDVEVFTSWLDAVATEIANDEIPPVSESGYTPVEGTLSAFYFQRMRDEFKVALEAWLETDPLNNAEAEPTPFQMTEYRQAASEQANDLLDQSATHRQAALDANKNSDFYVLLTVGFALVIFFAGVSSKLVANRNRMIMLVLAVVLFLGALTAGLTLPIQLPF